MVKIIYYADPTKEPVISEHNKLIDFLTSNFNSRDELLDLRFFDTELLCHEIDQLGGDFLDIDDGVVAITHDSMIPKGTTLLNYAFSAAVASAAVSALAPNIPNISTGRDQQSGTNALGDSTNEARVNQRIDDIFGTVSKHVPSLWQVPYKVGINNKEAEVLLCCVGRGKYDIDPDNWYDGDTPVVNIPNASVNIYEPYTTPNLDEPNLVIGDTITEKIGIYRQSNDLNPAELQPPNARENAGIEWVLSGDDGNAVMTASSLPDGFDFDEFYNVDDYISLSDMFYTTTTGDTINLNTEDSPSSIAFPTYTQPVDLGDAGELQYRITNVSGQTITLEIPGGAPVSIVNAWSAMSNYSPVKFYASVYNSSLGTYYVTDQRISTNSWFWYEEETVYNATVNNSVLKPISGAPFNNVIGPLFVPENADEVILNFTSANGFYKLDKNDEVTISTHVLTKFIEIDENDIETGQVTSKLTEYESNDSITDSVFTTARLAVPYARCKITCERVGDRDKDEDISNIDKIEWRDFYTFQPVDLTDFGDVTLAHVLIPSNSQSRLIKQRKQNVDVTRKITEYLGDGNLGPAESFVTDRFDQILIHQALDPYIGRMTLENINADGFMDIHDEIMEYFGSDNMVKFGYNFDTTELTAQDTFMLIADTVMCTPFVQSGVYDLFFEKKQTVSTMQVTCRNKIMDSETRKFSFDRKYDGVELTYRDNDTGTSETIYVPSDQSSRNPERKEISGCTTYEQAYKYAHRVYNRQKYQTELVTFDVDSFGRNMIPNKRIDSPDSTRFTLREGVTDGYRVYDGEVIEVNGLQVELSEPFEFTEGEDHYITFTKSNGDNSETILCTQIDDFTVSLNTMPSEPIYDGYEQDRTKYTLVSEQLQQSMALIPKTIEFNLSDDNTEVHTVNAVNYTDKYYQNDLDITE